MDLLHKEYLKENIIVATLTGVWPLLDPRSPKTLFIRIGALSLFITAGVTLAGKIYLKRTDPEVLMEIFPFVLVLHGTMTKYYNNCYFNKKKISDLVRRMEYDWGETRSDKELSIMKGWIESGKFYTNSYTTMMLTLMTGYAFLTASPLILDYFFPLNHTRDRIWYYPAEFFVDEEKYFPYMLLHENLVGLLVMSSVCAIDGSFMLFVHHVCGMFAVAGCRMTKAMNVQPAPLTPNHKPATPDFSYVNLVFGIKCHQRALEYATILDTAYSHCHLVIITECIVGMSFSLVQTRLYRIFLKLHRDVEKNDIKEICRHVFFFCGQLFHLFCLSYPGQRVTDQSEMILEEAYSSTWYNVSNSTKKLIVLVIRRSLNPSVLTAGGIYILLLQNFSMVIQTATSYFTVLSSVG